MCCIKCFDIVILVLVYRNTDDLIDFFNNLNISKCKVVVVNSYYDKESEIKFQNIARSYDADFISVPNKGYGYGNNRGCEYALHNYLFKYLIISNADVLVEKFDISILANYNDVIIAPQIINLKGKKQNPSSPFVPSRCREYLKSFLYKRDCRRLIWLLYAYSRLTKELFFIICKKRKRVFSAHGAFVIFPIDIVKRLYPFYNEDMFLFNEEEHLGRLARMKGVPTYYVEDIVVRHKEDGSVKIASINEFQMLRQSYMIYFNYWKNSF